ncbi:ATP-binding protein [Micromonospora rubida]|uniref:ATP-binding protein n=1 Tax=Micromonospora rubida TaxID=2697657 RepID=A0ABW7SJ66_9ACTN
MTATATDWVTANQRFLSAALSVLTARLTGDDAESARRERDEARRAMPVPPAVETIGDAFGLSAFERDLVLLCAGVELDTALARACAAAHGKPRRPYVTFGLALATLPDAHWSAITPAAALRTWHLVELAQPDFPTTSPLRVDERILHALTGISYLDPRIAPLATPPPPVRALPDPLVAAADRVAACWSADAGPRTGRRAVRLHGRHRGDRCAVAVAASVGLGLRPVLVRADDLPSVASDRDLMARLCERETVLDGRCWLIEVDDAARLALDFAVRLRAPTVLISREPMPDEDEGLPQIEVAPADPGERRALWRRALDPAPGEWVDRVAAQFDLPLSEVDTLADEVDPADPNAGADLWDACRRRARPALDDLAQRIDTPTGWDDLVLPGPHLRTLREISAQIRHRMTVLADWGFAAQGSRGTGLAALFTGASGTGKTLAAEVLAADLRLDLYRVDLSQVVSKYIGETEKNLRRIFDAAESGGAVLLFDEADALFGKRSEVKDSHDRYANIEVSYLLQRMETYRGLAILTTNLKSALDPAFLRRLRFVVHFPLPDAAARERIWRRMFPPQAPTEGLDPAKLARLNVTGGTIRTVALSAAFLAAEADEPIRMSHVLAATRTEYAKLEKPLADVEVSGWTT